MSVDNGEELGASVSLEAFGYGPETQDLENRVAGIVRQGNEAVIKGFWRQYGAEVLAPILGKTPQEAEQTHEAWKSGAEKPDSTTVMKLAIANDFVSLIAPEIDNPETIKSLFLGPTGYFADNSMADALRTVDTKDLALVHKSFRDISQMEMYSAGTIEPRLEKYFGGN